MPDTPKPEPLAAPADPAVDEWMSGTYEVLRELARQCFGARGKSTLQPTALVHEAYLRISADGELRFPGRAQFLAYATKVVRSVVVDHARRRRARGRHAAVPGFSLEDAAASAPAATMDLLDLDLALNRLAQEHPRAAHVVELRYFGGLAMAEIAYQCQVSTRTVDQDWAFGRAFLARHLARGGYA